MNAKAMMRLKDHRVDWGIIVSKQGYVIGRQSRLEKLVRIFEERWRACNTRLLELCRGGEDHLSGPTCAAVDCNQYDAARPVLIQRTVLPSFGFVKMWKRVNIWEDCRQRLVFRTHDAAASATHRPVNIRKHDSIGREGLLDLVEEFSRGQVKWNLAANREGVEYHEIVFCLRTANEATPVFDVNA